MSDPLKVTHHDNRGNDEFPFGFVYFNDDTRVGYADLPENEGDGGVFATHPGVYKATHDPGHLEMARAYLHSQGVKGY